MPLLPVQQTGIDYELWENATRSIIVLKRQDQLGYVVDEILPPGRKVHLTPAERRYNQEQSATVDMDWFKNGRLRPVKLLDSEEDTPELRANVNAMSESELAELFKERITNFRTRIGEVKNTAALNRMLEIAGDNDATVKQVEALQVRLSELANANVPNSIFKVVDAETTPMAPFNVNPVTSR